MGNNYFIVRYVIMNIFKFLTSLSKKLDRKY